MVPSAVWKQTTEYGLSIPWPNSWEGSIVDHLHWYNANWAAANRHDARQMLAKVSPLLLAQLQAHMLRGHGRVLAHRTAHPSETGSGARGTHAMGIPRLSYKLVEGAQRFRLCDPETGGLASGLSQKSGSGIFETTSCLG